MAAARETRRPAWRRRRGSRRAERLAHRGGVGARRGERADDVEPTRTLGVGPGSGQRVGGGLDDRLDLVGREVGPALEQQRDGARDDGGGLRRAAALEQVVAHARLGVREVEGRVRVAQARDRAARRDEVGVAAQAAARPRGHDVVGHGGGAGQVVGADREDEGVVARRGRGRGASRPRCRRRRPRRSRPSRPARPRRRAGRSGSGWAACRRRG